MVGIGEVVSECRISHSESSVDDASGQISTYAGSATDHMGMFVPIKFIQSTYSINFLRCRS